MTLPGAKRHRWLALLPTLLVVLGVPWANRARPFVLGLPFLLFWMLACVVTTSAVMAIVRSLDRRAPPPPPAVTPPRNPPRA